MNDEHLYEHEPPPRPAYDVWWGEPIVTDEVRDALATTEVRRGWGEPVSVILEVVWDQDVSALARFIQETTGIEPRREDQTDRFIKVNLTGEQVEVLREREEAERKVLSKPYVLFKIWSDKLFRPQGLYLPGIDEDALRRFKDLTCIKALASQRMFDARGQGVHWAVIDTGIDVNHPWWAGQTWDDNYNIDFSGENTAEDLAGHGTHIAGIIKLVAPEVTLYNFKAIAKEGGSSFSLIRAMYHVRMANLQAGHTKIQGVNLSVGGPVPVKSYGCGWSPECQEANALVNSGVVVCAAASNDGYKILPTITDDNDLEYYSTYMTLGITDPGNAEEVITVGSTHSEFPHRYGPSYFSSKGPTGDGRFKPDVLAPGEKIYSAWPDTAEMKSLDDLVSLSGTSMATAHVSGAIAQFLSVKPEFIGLPRQVKRMLMDTCVDLERDRNFQGSGLIDVLNLIQSA
jgi:subtilisin family serine protease